MLKPGVQEQPRESQSEQVQIRKLGVPAEAVEVVDVPAPEITAPDEVLVRVQVAPVGPADIATLSGWYPRPYKDSVVPGGGAIGVIEAIGPDARTCASATASCRFDSTAGPS